MKLTKNFDLEEFLVSRHFPDTNRPDAEQKARLKTLAETLEIIRDQMGDRPVTITSGFRSLVNNALVGGAQKSDHLKGYAADFQIAGYKAKQIFNAIMVMREAGLLNYDQLICYSRHVHISVAPRMRGQAW